MSRILLVDDSPHAQRIGERILTEEGHEVVTIVDGLTALRRFDEVKPDLILAAATLPGQSGYEFCQAVKSDPQRREIPLVLTLSPLDMADEEQTRRAGCDATLRKPFEASVVTEVLKPLLEAAAARKRPAPPALTAEQVRAAVVVAVDAAMPLIIDEITDRVLLALGLKAE